jgi:predicted methyltransferase
MTEVFYCEVDKCDEVIRLKQENERLKKQIESDKGLITIGGKQQYQYLQRIDELEQENKELKEMYRLSCLKCEYKNTKADVDNYRSVLEEIREIVTSAFAKQRPYKEDFAEIENVVNKVLNKG